MTKGTIDSEYQLDELVESEEYFLKGLIHNKMIMRDLLQRNVIGAVRSKLGYQQMHIPGESQKIMRLLFQESDTSVQFYETADLHISNSFAQNFQISENEKNNDCNYLVFVIY